jgi:hypothetical protein
MITFPALHAAAFTQPAIDNHAHPLLRAEMRHKIPFEGVISEAEGKALLEDAPQTLACFRATKQLARLYGLEEDNVTWEYIKGYRATLNYTELCELCFKKSGIECILIDDGLTGTESLAEEYKWHEKFISGKAKKIVRIEVVAEVCKFGARQDTDNMFIGDITGSSAQTVRGGYRVVIERIRSSINIHSAQKWDGL